ncbi:ribosome-inactivating family protein [Streptomyces chrestomyceticus]|uniref:Ribosome-inactivating family protein n=1 Tax=Streptomyces chrestomyceticus TaxID=68185 RepID=A0ABU7X2B1_9ACTN
MHPIGAVRRAGRRLGTMLLALLATCTLVTVGAPSAHAETTERYLRLEWNLRGLHDPDEGQNRERQYREFIRQLRAASGSRMAGVSGNDMFDTPARTRTNRVVQVSVVTDHSGEGIHLILYFSLDDMYLRGFTVGGQNYQFTDSSYDFPLADEIQRANGGATPLFHAIYSGSYRTLDPHDTRGGLSYAPENMARFMDDLRYRFAYGTRNTYQRHLAYIIGATAEAARFGWIENRIAAVLNRGRDYSADGAPSTLGNFGMELQTHWSDLSRVAHQTSGGGTSNPVYIDGRSYSNISQIRIGTGGVPPLVPFLALYSAKP